MKYQTTKKAIRERAYKIIAVGYCDLWYLLRDLDPFAYSARADLLDEFVEKATK